MDPLKLKARVAMTCFVVGYCCKRVPVGDFVSELQFTEIPVACAKMYAHLS